MARKELTSGPENSEGGAPTRKAGEPPRDAHPQRTVDSGIATPPSASELRAQALNRGDKGYDTRLMFAAADRLEDLETVAIIARRCLSALDGEELTIGIHPILKALDAALKTAGKS